MTTRQRIMGWDCGLRATPSVAIKFIEILLLKNPACMSNKSPGMCLQDGLDAVSDLIIFTPYFETSSTKGSMQFFLSKSRNRHLC